MKLYHNDLSNPLMKGCYCKNVILLHVEILLEILKSHLKSRNPEILCEI